jgi:hypothetical protein
MILLLMLKHNYVSTLKGALNRYPKVSFTNTFEIRYFVSVKYNEIWYGGAVFKRDNIANISYHIIFCNSYLQSSVGSYILQLQV